MEVKVAEIRGFCHGVKRAVDLAMGLDRPGHTLGPLIHNEFVVEKLSEKNIDVIENPEEVNKDVVVIRAHGAEKHLVEELEKMGVKLIDGTCPLVKRLQDVAKDFHAKGYHVIVYGDYNHPEVKALVSYLDNYSVMKEVFSSMPYDKVAIVSQTTQSSSAFEKFVSDITKSVKDVVSVNTICDATRKRQESALSLAKEVDCMVVIGGRSSSNTKRLHELCSSS